MDCVSYMLCTTFVKTKFKSIESLYYTYVVPSGMVVKSFSEFGNFD